MLVELKMLKDEFSVLSKRLLELQLENAQKMENDFQIINEKFPEINSLKQVLLNPEAKELFLKLMYTADFIQWDKDFEAYRARFIHGPFDKFFESKFTL